MTATLSRTRNVKTSVTSVLRRAGGDLVVDRGDQPPGVRRPGSETEQRADVVCAHVRGSVAELHAPLLVRGALEDDAMSRGVQAGLASGANTVLEFGRHESAIGHFHGQLAELLDDRAS